jgi:hypothetical protein
MLDYLVTRHQRKVDMLEQHGQLRSTISGIGPDPTEDRLVDGAFRGDEELLARDERDQLKPML